MKISIDVCDLCKDPDRSVTHYTITADGVTGHTDRCDEHGDAFAQVLTEQTVTGKKTPIRKERPVRVVAAPTFRSESSAPRRSSSSGRRVTSIEAIEAAKRKR